MNVDDSGGRAADDVRDADPRHSHSGDSHSGDSDWGDAGPDDAGPGDADLDRLASGWLTLPELAERVGEPLSTVRQWVRERKLVVVERGTPPVKRVPVDLVRDDRLVKGLAGALTVLADAGYAPEQALRWLLSEEPSLPGRPVDAMAEGRDTAVKRRAMTLAF